MPSVPTKEATSDLSKLIQRASENGERIVLRQDGNPIAAIVSYKDFQRFEELEEFEREDIEAAQEAIAEGGKPIPWDEAKKEAGNY